MPVLETLIVQLVDDEGQHMNTVTFEVVTEMVSEDGSGHRWAWVVENQEFVVMSITPLTRSG